MLVRKVIILDFSIFDKKRFNYFEIKDESFNLIVQYYLKKVSSKYNLFPVCESILWSVAYVSQNIILWRIMFYLIKVLVAYVCLNLIIN